MAKKKARRPFSIVDSIREELTKRPDLQVAELIAAMKAKHPGQKFSDGSLAQAFYSSRRKRERTKKPVAGAAGTADGITLHALQVAKDLISLTGSVDRATVALRSIQKLQFTEAGQKQGGADAQLR